MSWGYFIYCTWLHKTLFSYRQWAVEHVHGKWTTLGLGFFIQLLFDS